MRHYPMEDKTAMSIPSKRAFGFNVIGYVSANLGLGVNARNLTRLLLDKGLPVAIYDLDPGLGRSKHDLAYEQYFVKTPDELPYCISVFIIGHDMTDHIIMRMRQIFLREDCINVYCPMWELTVTPEIKVKAAQMYDAVIAESDFIRSTCENHLSTMRIISAVPPLYLPAEIVPSRTRFGLPEDKVIFLSGFDPYSDPARKNPFAVIGAFRQAFGDDPKACLVIYLNCADPKESKCPGFALKSYKEMEELCRDDSRICLVSGTTSYADRLNLYASCDIFVSLHRSEGLGLVPMEFMRLGKPVIATAWSGNMTYMKDTNSCLVRYKLIQVKSEHPTYCREAIGDNAVWADPDVEEAAAWMRKLVEDPDLRAAIGRQAAIDMASFQKKAEEGSFIDEIRAIWEHGALLPGRNNCRTADFKKFQNYYLWCRLKWIGIRLWHSVFLPVALYPRNCFRKLYRAAKELGA